MPQIKSLEELRHLRAVERDQYPQRHGHDHHRLVWAPVASPPVRAIRCMLSSKSCTSEISRPTYHRGVYRHVCQGASGGY